MSDKTGSNETRELSESRPPSLSLPRSRLSLRLRLFVIIRFCLCSRLRLRLLLLLLLLSVLEVFLVVFLCRAVEPEDFFSRGRARSVLLLRFRPAPPAAVGFFLRGILEACWCFWLMFVVSSVSRVGMLRSKFELDKEERREPREEGRYNSIK